LLDARQGGTQHADSLAAQARKLADADATPSAKVLAELRANGGSFAAFGLQQSERHAAWFRAHPPTPGQSAYFDQLAESSLAEQRAMEAAPAGSFDDFVAAYRASTLCSHT